MQNSYVPKTPESPKPADRKAVAEQDYFLEPLPVPDATESNTDTAWSLWEHTLQSTQNAEAPTQAADLPDFPDTVQSGLPPLVRKPTPKV